MHSCNTSLHCTGAVTVVGLVPRLPMHSFSVLEVVGLHECDFCLCMFENTTFFPPLYLRVFKTKLL